MSNDGPRKLVLHIGTEKTATTSIQDFVYANRAPLAEHGVQLADGLGVPNNQKIAAYFQNQIDDYMKDRRIYTMHEKDAYFDGFDDEMRREFAALLEKGSTVFITSELLHSRLNDQDSIDSLAAFLRSIFDEIKVLCYIREQSALATSFYSTTVKAGNTDDFDTFLAPIGPDAHYYNYEQFLAKWEHAFGIDALRVKIFDRDRLYDGNILKDVVHETIPAPRDDAFDWDLSVSNESLGPIGVSVARVFNEIYPRYKPDGEVNHFRWELINLVSRNPLCLNGKILNWRSDEIYDSFNEINTRVGQRYCGTEGNPFPRPRQPEDSPEQRERTAYADSIAEFVRMLFGEVIGERVLERARGSKLREISDILLERDFPLGRVEQLLDIAVHINPDGPLIHERLEQVRAMKKAT
ncbi:hypothetical protein [Mesobacterium pallidum]|uniref:hypothetical protein n=1 Tax=Mesobacterium pallidum TaxID=2872037 RepID=UPI001EE36E21|nr:hypothetical protein [Mesobacterium pallidum]